MKRQLLTRGQFPETFCEGRSPTQKPREAARCLTPDPCCGARLRHPLHASSEHRWLRGGCIALVSGP